MVSAKIHSIERNADRLNRVGSRCQREALSEGECSIDIVSSRLAYVPERGKGPVQHSVEAHYVGGVVQSAQLGGLLDLKRAWIRQAGN